jgi:hypothetical protein
MKIDLKERFKLFISQTENYYAVHRNQPSIHDLIDLLNFTSKNILINYDLKQTINHKLDCCSVCGKPKITNSAMALSSGEVVKPIETKEYYICPICVTAMNHIETSIKKIQIVTKHVKNFNLPEFLKMKALFFLEEIQRNIESINIKLS